MSDAKRLSDEELAYIEQSSDVSHSYIVALLAEIRESRTRQPVCATCAMFAAQDNASAVAPPALTGTVEDFEAWLRANLRDDITPEIASRLVDEGAADAKAYRDRAARPAAALTTAEVEALRYWRPLIDQDSNTDQWRAFLAALDKLLAQGGAK